MLYKTLCGLLLMCVVSCAISQEEQQETENTKRPSWSEGLPERQKAADLNKPEFKPEIDNEIDMDMSEFGLKPKASTAEIEIGLPISEELPADQAQPSSSEVVETAPEPVIEAPAEVVEEVAQPAVADTAVVDELPQDDLVDTDPATEVVDNSSNDVPVETFAEAPVESVADESVDSDVIAEQAIPVEQSIAAVEPPPTSQPLDVAEAATEKAVEYQWSIVKQAPVDYPPKAAMDNLEGWVDVEVTIDPSGNVVAASPVAYSRKGRVFGKNAIRSVKKWVFAPPSEQGVNNNVTRVYKIEFQF